MGKKKNKNSGPNPQDQLINLQSQQLAAQVANWAAQLDFQKARFEQLELPEWQQRSTLDVDKFAWERAEATWENAFKEATLTGTYQGQPTMDWLTRQAQLTGVMGGQQTLQGRLTDAQIAQMEAETTGLYKGQQTLQGRLTDAQIAQMRASQTGMLDGVQTLQGKLTDAQIAQMNQQMKLANDEFLAGTTGYYNGVKTFDREKWEANQATVAWQFMSTLSGPQNAFKQARAIGSMPGGLRQMMDAWAGTYATPGSTSVGSGGAASLGDMMLGSQGDRAAVASAGTSGINYDAGAFFASADPQPLKPQVGVDPGATAGATIPGYTYSPAGAQAPVDAWNYTPTPMGNTQVYPPGVVSPAHTPDVSSNVPLTADQVGTVIYGGTTYQGPQANPDPNGVRLAGQGGSQALLPNQINAQNYGTMYQYQKDLGWAAYEDAGWDKGLAQEAFQRSLPTYGGPERGRVAAF